MVTVSSHLQAVYLCVSCFSVTGDAKHLRLVHEVLQGILYTATEMTLQSFLLMHSVHCTYIL